MNRTRSALVIGGGIAGPVAAMALRRAGIEASVYEAYPTPADGVGAGLSIASNGLAALGVVLVAVVRWWACERAMATSSRLPRAPAYAALAVGALVLAFLVGLDCVR